MSDAPAPPALGPVRLRYEVQLHYEVHSAGSDFIFNIQAARTPQQCVFEESLGVSQPVGMQEHVDPGSHGRYLRLRADRGALAVRYAARLALWPHLQAKQAIAESWIPSLPGDVLSYLYPSRYCESDLLASLAMEHFGSMWQGYGRVEAICAWVQSRIRFASGSSDGSTTAAQTLTSGRGVCRDFAHLMIALCRALNIPARFVTGLDYGADPALGPTDFHAYVEAYLGGRWYLFDPSGTAVPAGLIRLTSGRDAADCAYASIFGLVQPLSRFLSITLDEAHAGPRPLPRDVDAARSTAAC